MDRGLAKKISVSLAIALTVFVITAGASAQPNDPLPSFGSGPTQVRLYTDYFCPPCAEIEPVIEPILKALLKKKAIQLIMVDVPFSRYTPTYAKYFLYAVNGKSSPDRAFHVKRTLFKAANGPERVDTPDKLEKIFKDKGIDFSPYNARPVFERYNELIKEDKVDTTPSCVIYRGGMKEKFTGAAEVVEALKRLQKAK